VGQQWASASKSTRPTHQFNPRADDAVSGQSDGETTVGGSLVEIDTREIYAIHLGCIEKISRSFSGSVEGNIVSDSLKPTRFVPYRKPRFSVEAVDSIWKANQIPICCLPECFVNRFLAGWIHTEVINSVPGTPEVYTVTGYLSCQCSADCYRRQCRYRGRPQFHVRPPVEY
jgi:hypothetical protein